ncbi:cell wall-active antibiotics response protein LiaF [Cytobacillus sp. Hm23]|uniref:cell wall-active antibiotics response protein LiaF n=1 Tax=Cytobacillus sp. IB215665 TaxID=3097357 RepID=UPI002A12E6F7|nr:cell wall-active antibiotics response protein LiaF [Cytobacillus sp. IB215665]MDX8367234.1 cell wall-active antibiotics response protein LiaF [Cytobacillus sp. IB215665]
MFNKITTEQLSWIVVIIIAMLLLEVSFFNSGVIFSLIVSISLIYIGRKRMPKASGKILFWFGLLFTLLSVTGMMTFKLLLLVIIIFLINSFVQSKKEPSTIKPTIKEPEMIASEETLITRSPLMKNILIGQQQTPSHVYEWNDVNIQAGIGNTVIDLSYTVLPKGETIIFIRNFIGNIEVLIPYDLEVSIRHSVFIGSSTVFEVHDANMFNQVFSLQTPQYDNVDQKIKIVTSMIVGNIEVKRV